MLKRISQAIRFTWYRTCARLYLSWRTYVTILLVMVMAVILAQGIKGIYLDTTAPGEELKSRLALTAKVTDERLTGWVYKNSTRISVSMSKDIVGYSMNTKHPLLMLALVSAESEFTPTAVSVAGAKGLTQVMWKIWGPDLIKAGIAKEERDLFDPSISIRAGEYVLVKCLTASGGDVTKALERYLGGKDGFYTKKILSRLADMYVLVQP